MSDHNNTSLLFLVILFSFLISLFPFVSVSPALFTPPAISPYTPVSHFFPCYPCLLSSLPPAPHQPLPHSHLAISFKWLQSPSILTSSPSLPSHTSSFILPSLCYACLSSLTVPKHPNIISHFLISQSFLSHRSTIFVIKCSRRSCMHV